MNDYLNYQGYQIRVDLTTHTAHVGLLGPTDEETGRATQPETETPFGPHADDAAAIAAAKAAIDNREV